MNPKLQPALVGGILGAAQVLPLPIVNAIDCGWMTIGTWLAVFLYFRGQEPSADKRFRAGASLGLFAGLIAAVVCTVIRTIGVAQGWYAEDIAVMQTTLEAVGTEVPSFVPELFGAEGVTGLLVASQLVFYLVGLSIVGTISGLVGTAIFDKKRG